MNGTTPRLPQTVSSDGREIWDWAHRFSAHVQRNDRVAQLRRDIAKIGESCGDCDKWMKSRQCPREHNVNGRRQGPSMAAPRGSCPQFLEDREATERRARLTLELTTLTPENARD